MTTVTDRPNATVSAGVGWTVTGGASAHAVLADDSDASYITPPAPPPTETPLDHWVKLGFPNTAVPAGASIVQVRVRIRAQDPSSTPWEGFIAAKPYVNGSYATNWPFSTPRTPVADFTGPWMTSKPGGGAWTQADLDAMEVHVFESYNYTPATPGKLFEVWRDIEHTGAGGSGGGVTLTVSASAASGVARPTFSWSHDGTQQSWRAKVFSAAQYGAGGFDPATNTPTWDSGEVISPTARAGTVGIDLVDAVTYKVYLRVRLPDVGGAPTYTAWVASGTVTIDTAPATPNAPGLTATADNPHARVVLAYTKNNPDSATTLSIEYSDDNKATWLPHPALTALPIAGSGTAYDYESPPRLQRHYRAKVTVAGLSSVLPTSGQPSAIVQTDHWCIKDVLDPAANVIANKAPMGAQVVEMTHDYEEPQHVATPVGLQSTHYIVTSEGVRKPTGTIMLRAVDRPAYDALMAITQRGRSLLVQNVLGQQWFVKLGSPHSWRQVRVADPLGVLPVRWVYEAQIPYVSTTRPSL